MFLMCLPNRTIFPFYIAHTSISSYITLHPLSQNFLMKINDDCDMPGIMCVSVMAADNQWVFRLYMCVDIVV